AGIGRPRKHWALEGAHDVNQSVYLAHVLDQLLIEAGFDPLRRLKIGPGDVNEADFGIGFLFGVVKFGETIDSGIWYFDHADIGTLAAAKTGFGGQTCQRVEYCGLSRPGKSNYPDFHDLSATPTDSQCEVPSGPPTPGIR